MKKIYRQIHDRQKTSPSGTEDGRIVLILIAAFLAAMVWNLFEHLGR